MAEWFPLSEDIKGPHRGHGKHLCVAHVMNYTDVEDKVIRRAKDLGVDPLALGERYRAEYDQHLRDLGILPATSYPRASEEIKAILEMAGEFKPAAKDDAATGKSRFSLRPLCRNLLSEVWRTGQ